MLDHWLCRVMLPALPANVRVVIGGRNAPFDRWRSYGPLLCSVPLGNLSPDEADELLRRNGVDGETAPRINAVAHGHPLSLQLAAASAARPPGAGDPGDRRRHGRRGAGARLPRRARRADAPRAQRRRADPPHDAVAARRDAARRARHRGLRPPARAAVRGADGGRAAGPRHRARGDRGAAARRRPAGVLAPARRRLELPARRAARRPAPRAPALHGRPPVPDRGGVGTAGVLPRRRRRAARPARDGGRPAGDGGARARRGRRPARLVGGRARQVHRRLQGHGRRGRLRLPGRAGRREPARDRRRPAREPLARAPAERPDPARPAGALPALGRPDHGHGGAVRAAARRDARLHGDAARAAPGLRPLRGPHRARRLVRDGDGLPAARGRAGDRVHGLRPGLGRRLAGRARRPPAPQRRRGGRPGPA